MLDILFALGGDPGLVSDITEDIVFLLLLIIGSEAICSFGSGCPTLWESLLSFMLFCIVSSTFEFSDSLELCRDLCERGLLLSA
jgi:hypothetical protein